MQNITGDILQGFQITSTGVGTTLTDVSLTSVQSTPQATGAFTLSAQLDGSEVGIVPGPNAFTFNSPIQIFNSVGTQDILNIEFTKQNTATNVWDYVITSQEGVTIPAVFSGTLGFDTSGQLLDVDGAGNGLSDVIITLDYTSSSPPASPPNQTVTWNLTGSDMTAFAAPSSNHSVIQDGFGSGILTGVAVGFDGTVSGLFDNGQSQPLFQLGLANFLAPTGLARLGSNLFAETRLSGQANISLPETGALGSVLGNTLELSNVDLAEEFVQLIKAQQAFTASARVISTTDELLTETVNLTR